MKKIIGPEKCETIKHMNAYVVIPEEECEKNSIQRDR